MMTCSPGKAALLAGARRRGADEVRQPGEIGLAVEHERIGLLVGEMFWRELRAERRETLEDRRKARLRLRLELRAGADEMRVVAVEDARLFGVEAELVARSNSAATRRYSASFM